MAYRKQLLTFFADKYLKDLEQAMYKAMTEARNYLYKSIMQSLSVTPFKDNPVKILKGGIAGGVQKANIVVTSDLKRKASVIQNVQNTKYVSLWGKHKYQTYIRYTANNWDESHVGIYYEFGIGSNYIPGSMLSKKFNPPLVGATSASRRAGQVVSRSRHIDYQGLGKGVWTDMGGNVRITRSTKAGQHNNGFRNYIGEETKAYRWFYGNPTRRAKDKKQVRSMFRQALKSVNIFNKKYWKWHGKFILGRD